MATSHRGDGALGPQNVADAVVDVPVPLDIVEEDTVEFVDNAIHPTEVITASAAAQSNANFIQLQLTADAARSQVPMSSPLPTRYSRTLSPTPFPITELHTVIASGLPARHDSGAVHRSTVPQTSGEPTSPPGLRGRSPGPPRENVSPATNSGQGEAGVRFGHISILAGRVVALEQAQVNNVGDMKKLQSQIRTMNCGLEDLTTEVTERIAEAKQRSDEHHVHITAVNEKLDTMMDM